MFIKVQIAECTVLKEQLQCIKLRIIQIIQTRFIFILSHINYCSSRAKSNQQPGPDIQIHMQFISDRQSLASSFAFQTQNSSSYLLSSRASRRKILYEEGDDAAQQEIQDFKLQIEEKFIESVTNKIYTFPLKYDSFDYFDDQDINHLKGDVEICLHEKDGHSIEQRHKQDEKYKIMYKKPKNPKVNAILNRFKGIKENIMALTLYHQEAMCESSQRPKQVPNNVSVRKSKGKNQRPELKSGRTKITYQTNQSQEQSPSIKRHHLHTEPYEKPMGYILKKK